ncbi:MAG: type II toxin-antitoxin system PemK/MazF family toxin [Thermoanaerobacteraceae bacterium]|nr:type II toxin-antitoxin system PemK/MazF family toxin [Thermoanaerobacteraceae bacterium]
MSVGTEAWRVKRGDIYAINLGYDAQERPLIRPVLVVQNDIGNRLCNTVIVVPLTPEKKTRKVLFGVIIPGGKETGLREDYMALFSQIRTLGKERFHEQNFLGTIDGRLREEVNEALQLSLGLSALQQIEDRLGKR